MRTVSTSPVRHLLGGHWPQRSAGPAVDDAVRVARWAVSSGRLVSLEHVAADPGDDLADLSRLIDLVSAAGLAPSCEVLVRVDRLGVERAGSVLGAARQAALGVVLAGRPAQVGPLSGEPDVAVVVPAAEPGAEARCRALAGARVRLQEGAGAAADLAFVRCLNLLMAGDGYVAVAAEDLRLIAIAGERAAWYGRAPESWEHVLPQGRRVEEQQRLVAAGHRVRVRVRSGAASAWSTAAVRRLGGGAWRA